MDPDDVEVDKDAETDAIYSKKKKTHPDGGYGWLVVFCGFSVQFITVGMQNSSGTMLPALLTEYKQSEGETAWVGSLGIGVMFLCGPLTTKLCEKYSCRTVGCIGAFLCVFGLVVSSFAGSLAVMYVTYGVTWGLGASLCYFPTLIVLVQYFDKRLALVNGFVSAGSGLGTLVISPFIQYLLVELGLFHSLRVLALVNALTFVCALTFRPVAEKYAVLQRELHQPTDCQVDNKKVKLKSIWKEKSFIAWIIAISTFMLGYFVPFLYLKSHAVLVGVPHGKASFLVGILSITSTIGKVLAGKIADLKQVNIFYMYQTGLLTMSISTTLLPIGNGYPALVLYALVFGLGEACFVVLIPLITKEVVGIRRLSPALGSLFMIMAIPTMLGSPIAGWIYQYSGSFAVSFYVAGGFMAAGVCLIFLIPYFAEHVENPDEDMKILNKKPENDLENNEKEDSDFVLIKNPKSQVVVTNGRNRTESKFLARRATYCIFPCLPIRSRSGIEEGKCCSENEEQESNNKGRGTDPDTVEKMSVI